MKRYLASVLVCCVFGGLVVGLSSAQDGPVDPFAQREKDVPQERDGDRRELEQDVHREELEAHAKELHAEIKRVRAQFEDAKAAGKEGDLRELGQYLEELHLELREVDRAVHGDDEKRNEEKRHDEKRHEDAEHGELQAHVREIRLEIERLKEQWQIARKEGQEEKARELGNHVEELMVKLNHLSGELNADGREAEEKRDHDRRHDQEAGDQDRENGEVQERKKLEYFHQVLVQQLKQGERRLEEARERGNEDQVAELAEHQENLFHKLREVEATLRGEDRREHAGERVEHHDSEHDRRRQGNGNLEERLEHLHIAIEHLQAGGFNDVARHAIDIAEEISRGLHREEHAHEDRHDEHEERHEEIGREELLHKVRHLEEQLHHLNQEMEHIHRALERLSR